MKTTTLILFGQLSVLALVHGEDVNTERLWTRDTNKDGKLSKEELGGKLWQRMSAQDADADGALDQPEVDALLAKGRRGKKEQERPGGANLSFWETKDAAKMNGVAIWAFHGDQDEAVPVSGSRDMIAALKQAGVKPEPKYTELPGVGHGSWNDAYADAAMWEWMFAQRRPTPPPSAP